MILEDYTCFDTDEVNDFKTFCEKPKLSQNKPTITKAKHGSDRRQTDRQILNTVPMETKKDAAEQNKAEVESN